MLIIKEEDVTRVYLGQCHDSGYQLPTVVALVLSMSGHVGFEVDDVALEQVFLEYFSFLYQLPFHQLPCIH
jgi:hypothetical protein